MAHKSRFILPLLGKEVKAAYKIHKSWCNFVIFIQIDRKHSVTGFSILSKIPDYFQGQKKIFTRRVLVENTASAKKQILNYITIGT